MSESHTAFGFQKETLHVLKRTRTIVLASHSPKQIYIIHRERRFVYLGDLADQKRAVNISVIFDFLI